MSDLYSFINNTFSHTVTLAHYVYDGGCKKQLDNISQLAKDGDEKAQFMLCKTACKTVAAAVLAGIASSTFGLPAIIIIPSSVFVGANEIYKTDGLRQMEDTLKDYANVAIRSMQAMGNSIERSATQLGNFVIGNARKAVKVITG